MKNCIFMGSTPPPMKRAPTPCNYTRDNAYMHEYLRITNDANAILRIIY